MNINKIFLDEKGKVSIKFLVGFLIGFIVGFFVGVICLSIIFFLFILFMGL